MSSSISLYNLLTFCEFDCITPPILDGTLKLKVGCIALSVVTYVISLYTYKSKLLISSFVSTGVFVS